uniref:MH2 domain-containing protein n=1 Tax=Caenorhabditis tropicalis TaxID=1561998 RepID=A0A1I7U3E9_9PELO
MYSGTLEDLECVLANPSVNSRCITIPKSLDGRLQQTHQRPPPFRHPKSWAQITYFELNSRVGEVFKLVNQSITVDGYTDPSNSDTRICLGQLTNVNRNGTIENTRMHIGKGIQLDNKDHIMIINNSDMPVFVQSKNTNLMMNMPLGKVNRIPPHSQLCAFEFNLFFQMLEQSCNDRDGLNELSKHCFIRISFVKGWGEDYPRQDVTSTPCWLELRLNVPLAYIDQKMKQTPRTNMNEPNSMT